MSNAVLTENQKQWVHDLRTTDAKQGRGRLGYVGYDGVDRFCCLGRACEVAGVRVSSGNTGTYCYDGEYGLSESMQEWLGVTATGSMDLGAVYTMQIDESWPARYVDLTSLNDQWRLTFSQIADMVEYFGLEGDIPQGL